MKQIEWESTLLENLKPLGDEERFQIVEYYREIYADKLEAGVTSDEILAEFGSPEECAQKILQEAGKENVDKGAEGVEVVHSPITEKLKKLVVQKNKAKWTPSMIVGMTLLTLFIILPLAGGALGVIAAFAGSCIGGGAMVLGGGVYAVCSLFFGLFGMETGGVLAHFGMSLAAIGVGFLMCVVFYYATKYLAIACYKALLWIYKRGD